MVVHAWSNPHSGNKHSFPFPAMITNAERNLIMRYYRDHPESHSAWDRLEAVRRPFIIDAIRRMNGDFGCFFTGYTGS